MRLTPARRTLRGMNTAARAPMESVMAHDIAAYLNDRSVSFTKQCLGITSITSRFDGKVFSCSASPFNPLSITPSKSIVTGDGPPTATGGGRATAMLTRGRIDRTLAPLTADGLAGDEAKRAAAENDDWVVNAFVPHEHRVTMAEAVAATVPFILAMGLAVRGRAFPRRAGPILWSWRWLLGRMI